jgi:polar amino acid transport system substrate-binding protein
VVAENLRALLPASVRQSGVLTVATSAALPPQTYLDSDGKTVIGYFPDVINAAASRLGLTVRYAQTPFTGIIAGLQSKRYDLGITFLDTPERQAQVNIVDLFNTSEQYVTRSSGGLSSVPPCGKRVGVGAGSAEQTSIGKFSTTDCVAKGQPAIAVQVFPNNPAANLALSSGQIDATFQTSDGAAVLVTNSHGSLQLLGDPLSNGSVSGIALDKSSSELTAALTATFQSMVNDGSYLQILKKWHVEPDAVSAVTVNTKASSGS